MDLRLFNEVGLAELIFRLRSRDRLSERILATIRLVVSPKSGVASSFQQGVKFWLPMSRTRRPELREQSGILGSFSATRFELRAETEVQPTGWV